MDDVLGRKPTENEMSCKCDMRTKLVGDGCEHCNPELAAMITADNARRKQAPCMECGANNQKEAETMCRCSGDKDDCHDCELWLDAV